MRFVLLLLLCLMSSASNAEGLLDRLPGLGSSKQPSFLPPDKAFGLQVMVRDAHTLQANFSVTPGYYLYRDKIKFEIRGGTANIQAVNLPRGEMKQDPSFGQTEVFHNSIQAEIILKRPNDAAVGITLDAVYM